MDGVSKAIRWVTAHSFKRGLGILRGEGARTAFDTRGTRSSPAQSARASRRKTSSNSHAWKADHSARAVIAPARWPIAEGHVHHQHSSRSPRIHHHHHYLVSPDSLLILSRCASSWASHSDVSLWCHPKLVLKLADAPPPLPTVSASAFGVVSRGGEDRRACHARERGLGSRAWLAVFLARPLVP